MNLENKKICENGAIDIVFEDCKADHVPAVKKKQDDKKQGYRELVLDLLQKSPEIGHLLVRLHDRNKLYNMASAPDDLARAELTQIIIDLLKCDLSSVEGELISDVLLGVFKQAERELRRALVEKIAVMQGVPLRLLVQMASDEIYVADSLLRKSRDLEDFDLIYILKAQGVEHSRSIARRPQISNQLVDMLTDVDDVETSINLVKNKSISLTPYALSNVFEQAKTSDKLAQPLLSRDEMSSDLIARLYEHVGSELKNYIQDNFSGINIDEVIDETVDQLSNDGTDSFTPSNLVMKQAELMMETGALTPQIMIKALKSNQIPMFIAQFSVYCSVPVAAVQDILSQTSGQGLAIACKACSVLKSDFVNMFLLTSRLRSELVISENVLSRAMAYHDRIDHDVAKAFLAKYRH